MEGGPLDPGSGIDPAGYDHPLCTPFTAMPGFPTAAMASTLKRAKIENFCFHDLRHCAKTSWARRRIPAEVAMKAAGHKSWPMHARYIHIQKTDVATVFDCSRGFPKESSTPNATGLRG